MKSLCVVGLCGGAILGAGWCLNAMAGHQVLPCSQTPLAPFEFSLLSLSCLMMSTHVCISRADMVCVLVAFLPTLDDSRENGLLDIAVRLHLLGVWPATFPFTVSCETLTHFS